MMKQLNSRFLPSITGLEYLIQGLEIINNDDACPLRRDNLAQFLNANLQKLPLIIDQPIEAVVCSRAGHLLEIKSTDLIVIAGTDKFSVHLHQSIDMLRQVHSQTQIEQCMKSKQHCYAQACSVIYMHKAGLEACLLLHHERVLNASEQALIKVFCDHLILNIENYNLTLKLNKTTFNDWLTHLPNRNEFLNIVSAVKSSFFDNKIIALVDLKHFSDINDGLGQEIGNGLLVSVANRLRCYFDERTVVARITGDVFGIIGSTDLVTTQAIQANFCKPFEVGEHRLQLSVNIGLCELQTNKTATSLLRCANIALNTAKKDISSSCMYYNYGMDDRTTERLATIRRLQTDFEQQKLEVWYQPQVDLITEKVVGLEALVRWCDQRGKYISPEDFVPLAEYTGLIVDIGKWVLDESVAKLRALSDLGFTELRMAVNVSVLQFRDESFIDFVKQVLERYQITPSLLELEITESVIMDEPKIVIDTLNKLKDYGVTIALDDFGTGFSSMSYIQKMPLDRLKVDRSFVDNLSNEKNAFIAQAIVSLGKQLGLTIIAEGVETRMQASHMLKIGADEAQGFLYARPQSFAQLSKLLA